MTHPNWCGKSCCECTKPCQLDHVIPCSPDCPELDELTGEPSGEECRKCDAISDA